MDIILIFVVKSFKMRLLSGSGLGKGQAVVSRGYSAVIPLWGVEASEKWLA